MKADASAETAFLVSQQYAQQLCIGHMLIGILDCSFIVRLHLPNFWLLSIVLIISFLVGHLMGLDG